MQAVRAFPSAGDALVFVHQKLVYLVDKKKLLCNVYYIEVKKRKECAYGIYGGPGYREHNGNRRT